MAGPPRSYAALALPALNNRALCNPRKMRRTRTSLMRPYWFRLLNAVISGIHRA